LVVDDVQDHRGAIDAGERQGVVEVALRGGTLSDPPRGDPVVVPDGRGHGPTDGLWEVRGQIADNREKSHRLAGIHNRHLAALQPVPRVGEYLVHHVDQRPATGDEQSLLPIGRESHVAVVERHGLRNADCLLPSARHVERRLALALSTEHPVVIRPRQHHRPQTAMQCLGVQLWIPRADCVTVVVKHADQRVGVLAYSSRLHADIGTRD